MVVALGREAFYLANEAFENNDSAECRRGLKIALEINPAIARTSAYRRLELKMRCGPKLWSILRSFTRLVKKPNPVSL
jgi:hypothetical protein